VNRLLAAALISIDGLRPDVLLRAQALEHLPAP